jgi:branched-chain amino acid transport system ATP-binding protein
VTSTGNGIQAEGGTPLLEVRDLTVHHGQLRALDRVSLRVFGGEVYAIIGANGAGKSTLLRTIAGLHKATEGSILLDGQDMTRVRPERRATRGIVMVPEGRRLFESLTVEENLQVGATYARKGPWTIERVYELFGWMAERRAQRTAQLSGGEQQSVAIGRALVANPRVLLLDELSLGLAPVVVRRIYGMLPQILATGLTVLLVEQDVSQALRVASHLQCLLEGHTTLEGRPSDVTAEQVEAAYFGLYDPGGPGGADPGSYGGTDAGGYGETGPAGYGGTDSPPQAGSGGMGPPQAGSGGMGPPQAGSGGMGPPQGGSGGMGPPRSRGGPGGIAPPEETEPLWHG